MATITMKELLEAGVHFGHQTKRWNPKMKEYIFGERNGIYIIDLQKTLKLFKDASKFVTDMCSDGKTILGFYSLSPATVFYSGTSENLESGLAGREIPAFWLARRAVDRPVQGRGLAGQLLLAAGRRCVLASSEVGGEVLLIEATSERVAAWYASYGAMPLMDAPLKLVLPLKTLEAALRAAGAL